MERASDVHEPISLDLLTGEEALARRPQAVSPVPGAKQAANGSPQGTLRYLAFGRVVPAVWFALFGGLHLSRLVADIRALGPHPSLPRILFGPVHSGLYLAFICIPIYIYTRRPRPRASDGSILARVFAFTGTFMLLIFPKFFNGGSSLTNPTSWVQIAAGILLVASTALAIWGIACLQMNFSIIPEARRLVRSGPYRYVRHPLYAADIGAAISLVLKGQPGLESTVILLLFVAVQFGRTVCEERLLRANLPEYDDYARSTRRLIPFIL